MEESLETTQGWFVFASRTPGSGSSQASCQAATSSPSENNCVNTGLLTHEPPWPVPLGPESHGLTSFQELAVEGTGLQLTGSCCCPSSPAGSYGRARVSVRFAEVTPPRQLLHSPASWLAVLPKCFVLLFFIQLNIM